MPRIPNTTPSKILGKRQGRLVVTAKRSEPGHPRVDGCTPKRRYFLTIRCDCGHEYEIADKKLGHRRACRFCMAYTQAKIERPPGPPQVDPYLPAEKAHYERWRNMLRRCYDPNHDHYVYYGAQGITVDPRWHDLRAFAADVGPCPPGATLDRPDNDGPYAVWNYRWATPQEQANNRRPAGTAKDGRAPKTKGWMRRPVDG